MEDPSVKVQLLINRWPPVNYIEVIWWISYFGWVPIENMSQDILIFSGDKSMMHTNAKLVSQVDSASR